MSDAAKKNVLVVDDSRMSRMMIRAIILDRRPGWNVIEAGNGDEALQKVAEQAVDYATLDINMPGMDGFEVAERLHAGYPNIRVCLLSANIQESSRLRAEAVGAGFVKKPITEASIGLALEFLERA